MSELRCPFCQQELEQITTSNPLGLGRIEMAVCKKCMDKGVLHIMPIWDWQELIRARKALDVAVDALNKINMRCQNTVRNHLERATIRGELCDISFYARKAIDDIDNLEQITALE